jgi:hypothetical protein
MNKLIVRDEYKDKLTTHYKYRPNFDYLIHKLNDPKITLDKSYLLGVSRAFHELMVNHPVLITNTDSVGINDQYMLTEIKIENYVLSILYLCIVFSNMYTEISSHTYDVIRFISDFIVYCEDVYV